MAARSIIIVGAGGRLGSALSREYGTAYDVIGFNHAQLDLAHHGKLRAELGALDFDLLINCAAQTNVDRCETHRDEAFRLNAEAPRVLAEICEGKNARLIHISTDYVFDGSKNEPYLEEDRADPISVYGESKQQGEQFVLTTGGGHLVVRVCWIFGSDRPSFIDGVLKNARERDHVEAIADKFSTPTYTRDIGQMLRPLLNERGVSGILHLTNAGSCSWQEYAQWAIDCAWDAGIPMKARTVGALSLNEMKSFVAKRPVYTVLSIEKYQRLTGQSPRHWRDAVSEYVREVHSKL